MKIVGISLFMLGLLMSLVIGLDLVIGIDIKAALKNAFNPFRVMEPVELFVLSFFVVMFFAEAFIMWISKKKNTNKRYVNTA
ncbi:hypothetical protein [Alteribacillus sp. YIM 98480]|uniref:hypothetical protein n=1 Tax=Alteribacillus sp. YIM 98480 TaxID=2606599 RepID=UPI00131E35E7|nr:hypothetical protein [Alteribacillus sp. YIM 98480]